MKRKVIVVVYVILSVWLAFSAVWNISAGIGGLAKSRISTLQSAAEGNLCELKVHYAWEVYRLEHERNGGMEHFYFVYTSDDNASPFLIKESTSWFDENFSSNGIAKKIVTVTGEVKRFDVSTNSNLRQVNVKLEEVNKRVSETYYINAMYKTHYILHIVSGALMIVIVSLGANSLLSSGLSKLGVKIRWVCIGVSALMNVWVLYTLEVI